MPALRITAVRCPIDFDHQVRANTGKIRDVRADGMLSAEMHSAEAMSQF